MSVAIDISEPYCARGEVFARRSGLSLSQLFLKYVEEAIRRAEVAETTSRRRVELSPRVRALCGCIKIPAEFENRSYRDIVADELTNRYLDFEDAVQIAEALRNSADVIVTRDADGFKGSPIRVVSPEELISEIENR